MEPLTLTLDASTRADVARFAARWGVGESEAALRLLRRGVRAWRPRPVYDLDAIRAYTAAHAAEDLALADSDPEHRLALLIAEDEAA